MVGPASLLPVVDVANLSDSGRDPNKQVNEDSCGYLPTRFGHLLIVCDGMGGHSGGQQASQLAVATVARALETFGPEVSPGRALKEAIVQAGAAVFQLGGNHPPTSRPGSTCVSLLVHPGGTEIAHVGDSRAYLIRGRNIWQLTRDHSVVQQMIDHGVLTPEAARLRPDANVITRALGMRVDTDVELRDAPFPHEAGDVFVLASDGLCDTAAPEDILALVLGTPSLEKACSALVELANARGGPDNITVQLARVHSSAAGRMTEVPAEPTARPTEVLMGAPEPSGPDATVPDRPAPSKAAATLVLEPPSKTLFDPGVPGAPGAPGPTLIEAPPPTRPSPHPPAPSPLQQVAPQSPLQQVAPQSPLQQAVPHAPTTPLFGVPPPGTMPALGGVQPTVGPASSHHPHPLPSLDPNSGRRPGGVDVPLAAPSGWHAHPDATHHERTQRRAILLLLSGCVLVAATFAGLLAWWFLTKAPR